MKPDAISSAAAQRAVARLREQVAPAQVDDEAIAAFVDGGIEAVEPTQRAGLLRALAACPDLACVVADLARSRETGTIRARTGTIFGFSRSTWRLAWAACAILALGATLWQLNGADTRPADAIAILDGGVDGPTSDFADSLRDVLRRRTAVILWALLTVLTAPALMTFWHPRVAAPRPDAR